MGNSEVGHIHIGAGRLIPQDMIRIDEEIKKGRFYKNKVLLKTVQNVKKKKGVLHLMGLLSDGGVHSHINHLFALLDFAKKNGIKEVYIHTFLDGRDVPPKSAAKYLKQADDYTKKIGIGKIETIMGRFYAMDRDNRWNREHMAYSALAECQGLKYATWKEALNSAYKRGETDEFVKPSIIGKKETVCPIRNNDSVIFFNFRSDRARQLTKAFVLGEFNKFKRKKIIGLEFVSMTQYDKKVPCDVAYPPQKPGNTLGEIISKNGLMQFRIAETEKYAHVTYFINNGRESPNKNEDRILIPSPKVERYDKTPKMSAEKITQDTVKIIGSKKYDLVIMNYANADIVGHTGNIKATVQACNFIDNCLGKILSACTSNDYDLMITADHGNAEEMGKYHETDHSINKVPCFIMAKQNVKLKLKDFALYNIAPTILTLLDIKAPKEMEESMIVRK